jgi:hypothetical protein
LRVIYLEDDDFEIETYVKHMEHIIAQKLKIYNFLRDKIIDFKGHLRAEEEAHNMTIAKGFGNKK